MNKFLLKVSYTLGLIYFLAFVPSYADQHLKGRVLVTAEPAPAACQKGDYSVFSQSAGILFVNKKTIVYEYKCCSSLEESGFKFLEFGYLFNKVKRASFKQYVNPKTAIKDKQTGKWWVVENSKVDFIPACKLEVTSLKISVPEINYEPPIKLEIPKPVPPPGPFGPLIR